MSTKKKYRIRKAMGGENPGVMNPMSQFMTKAAQGMQQPSPEQIAMMQQEQMLQQQSSSQSENKVVSLIAQGMQQGVDPQEIVMQLLQAQIPENEIVNGFLQVTVLKAQESGKQISQEEGQALQSQIEQLVSTVMQQAQGSQQAQPSPEEMAAMEQEQVQQEQVQQEPRRAKGGFKRKLLESAREGKQTQTKIQDQTETPGSILPQPATLNTFIQGVKNEGNEFYAKEMTNVADSAGMFRRGGASDRKIARRASKQDPYDRGDRRALRQGLKSGEFNIDDLSESIGTGERLLPENYSNRDFKDIYKDLGTMGADFANTLMPQVFSHRNTDDEFSRKGTDLEDTDVDVYFKRKPFGRREWSISGLDYTSLPAYGGRGNYNADGTYAPYGTRTQTTYSKGVEGVRTIANEVNNANDDTDDPLIEREVNISGPVDPVMNYQNDPEGMFSDPSNDPLRQFTDPANPALSEAEQQALYEQEMAAKEAEGVINNPSDGSEMSLLEQLDYLKSQGHKSADLTPTYTDEEMPEENEKIVEEYKAEEEDEEEKESTENFKSAESIIKKYVAKGKTYKDFLKDFNDRKGDAKEFSWTYEYYPSKEDLVEMRKLFEKTEKAKKFDKSFLTKAVASVKEATSSNSNWLKQGEKLGFNNIDKAPPAYVESILKKYIDAGKTYDDFIKDRKIKNTEAWDLGIGWTQSGLEDNLSWIKNYPGWKTSRVAAEKNSYASGGSVHPDLYDYVYGGEDEIDPDQFKNITDPYFAPGGAFKEPKIDPALGVKRPSQEVQDYRENVYPTSKGIFGQVGDHLKGMVSPITQGQGWKGAINTAKEIIAPTDFTWLSQNKYGKKNALGYIGVDGLPNTIVRPWDEDSLYYNNETGYNTNNTGDRATGKYTNLDYSKKLFGKGRLNVTDTPVKTDRDGNPIQDSGMGFIDMFKGTEIPLPGNKPKIAFGGETLNKYVMAGEIDENFMEDQDGANFNLAENNEPKFDFSTCPEGWETDPTSECYKKSMEMGTDENEYKVNKARTIQAPVVNLMGEKAATTIVDWGTAIDNSKKFQHGFEQDRGSDTKAKTQSTDTGQGWDAITGYQSQVNSQFNEPVQVSSARPKNMNLFAAKGGQYAVGGVYEISAKDLDRIYAAGGTVEIIE
tara:strand:+ start:3257 stop:6670 length:3414 start_codon:yes stop_codon:yes gene_type:complete